MKYPKGMLIAIREKETSFISDPQQLIRIDEGFVTGLVPLLENEDAVIEIVIADVLPEDDLLKRYKKLFKKAGYTNISVLVLGNRDTANDKKTIQRLEQCDAVIFICKHPLKLCSLLGGTTSIRVLKERYANEPLLIAGINAGAGVLSDLILNEGASPRSYLKGDINVSIGFGFLNNLLIDANFDTNGRFGRIVQAIAEQPGKIYLGLPEATGIVIEKGHRLKVIGSNCVTVIDGSKIQHNNIASIKEGMPISMVNLVVHLVAYPDVFNLSSREHLLVQDSE